MTKRPTTRFLSKLIILGLLLVGGVRGTAEGQAGTATLSLGNPPVNPQKATANSVYTFQAIYSETLNQQPGYRMQWIGKQIQIGGGTEVLEPADKVDSMFTLLQIAVEHVVDPNGVNPDVWRVTLPGVSAYDQATLRVFSDQPGTTDITTSVTVWGPTSFDMSSDPGTPNVYVTFEGTAASAPAAPTAHKAYWTPSGTIFAKLGRSVNAAPPPVCRMKDVQDPLTPPAVTDYGARKVDNSTFRCGMAYLTNAIPPIGKDGNPVTELLIDYQFQANGEVATLDVTSDPTRKTIVLPANFVSGGGAPLVTKIIFNGDPTQTDYSVFIDPVASTGNILKLTMQMPAEADMDIAHQIRVDYTGQAIGEILTITPNAPASYEVPLGEIVGDITSAYDKETPAPTDVNLYTQMITTAGGDVKNGSFIASATETIVQFLSLPATLVNSDVNQVWIATTKTTGGNHIVINRALDPTAIKGIFDNAAGTGTDYFTPGATVTPVPADPNATPPTLGSTSITLEAGQEIPGDKAWIKLLMGGRSQLQLPDNGIGLDPPDEIYVLTHPIDDGIDGNMAATYDPATGIVDLNGVDFPLNPPDDKTKPAVPYVYFVWRGGTPAATVYLVGETFGGRYPMIHRVGSPISGSVYEIQLSAGLNSQNVPLTSLNGGAPNGFISAPGLTSQGGTRFTHRFHFEVMHILDDGNAEWIFSPAYSGPTVVDTNSDPINTRQRFGSSGGNLMDWINTWPELDPLQPEPVDLANPDSGSGSSTYTFRCVYRNREGLLPQPWLSPNRDPWNNTNFNSGVVVYIDEEGNGNYQPHFMIPEDPNSSNNYQNNDPTRGITYIYKVIPQAFGGAYGMPSGSNYQNGLSVNPRTYRSLTAGRHKYFFACSDDYIYDWNGNLVTTPDLEPIGPLNPYRNYNDFRSNYVDRDVNSPESRFMGYPFDCTQYPDVEPVLSRVNETDRTPLGGALFLGTLVPYQPMWEPAAQAGGQFDTAGLASGQAGVFRVTYTNANNDPPLWIKVNIYDTADATGTPLSYTMTPSASASPDYRAGVVYEYRGTLSPGPHSYNFTAADKNRMTKFPVRPDAMFYGGYFYDDPFVPSYTGDITRLANNDYVPGPYVNHPAILDNPSVSPPSGRLGGNTDFIYEVTYRDPDGQRPNSAFVVIQLREGGTLLNGGAVKVAMQAVTNQRPTTLDYTSGVKYRFQMASGQFGVLQPGQKQYYFEFTDDWGKQADDNLMVQGELTRLPAGAGTWVSGPFITNNHTPTIDGSVASTDGASNTASTFLYTCNYTDQDNDAPAYMSVYISDDNGNTWSSPHAMTKRDPSDNNYIDGCIYEFKTQLGQPVSQYRFKFVTSDGTDTVTSTVYTGPTVAGNTPPTLSASQVSPGTGQPNTSNNPTQFSYTITYSDTDGPLGQAPTYVKVCIDGTQFYTMTPVDDTDVTYNNGKTYKYTTTLPAGNHRYHFEASDGKDQVTLPVRDARTGQIDDFKGPIVLTLPQLLEPQVTPTSGGKHTDFIYTVTYQDQNAIAPDDGYPILWVDDPNELDKGNNSHVMAKVNPADTNYAQGVQYQVVLNTLKPGTHSYHVSVVATTRVGDVVDRTPIKTAEITGQPTVTNGLPILANNELAPLRGKAADSFTFKVNYSDPDNDAPEYVKLQVLTGAAIKEFAMAPVDATNNNYTGGVIYAVTLTGTQLGSGAHTHRFLTKDKDGQVEVALPLAGATGFDGPWVNSSPILSEPSAASGLKVLDPTSGTSRTPFTYTVVYTSANGTAPEYVKVYIDGDAPSNSKDMVVKDASPNYATGATFTYTGTIPNPNASTHSFWFQAFDGLETAILPVVLGKKYDGPTIAQNTAPTLSQGGVSPDPGTSADFFTYSVKYTDAQDDPPSDSVGVRVFIKGPKYADGAEFPMTRVDSNSYKDGTVYQFQTRLTGGSYTYYFRTNDGTRDITDPADATSPHVGPTVNAPQTWSNAFVTPAQGTTKTDFTFQVTYSSDQNPTIGMTVLIDNNAYTMTQLDPSDSDFSDGVIYGKTLKLDPGMHNFRFQASVNGARVPEVYPTQEKPALPGPMVYASPVLSDWSVTPSSGRIGQSFLLSVKYASDDGQAPVFVQADINGVRKDMIPAAGTPNYKAGVIYTLVEGPINETKTLSISFRTGSPVEQITAPTTPIIAAVKAKPSLTEESVDPGSGSSNTSFTYRVVYTDPDNVAPSYVKLYVSHDGGATWDAPRDVPKTGTNRYADGTEYSIKIPLAGPWTSMQYYFKAWDGFYVNGVEDPTTTATHDGPAVSYAAITLTVTPSTIMLTQSADIAGQLLTETGTGLAGRRITLTYFRPDGSSFRETVTTDTTGAFQSTFTPDMDNVLTGGAQPNRWLVRAAFGGDVGGYAASTTDVPVDVNPAEHTVPTSVGMISIPVMPRNGDPAAFFAPGQGASFKLARYMPDMVRYLIYGTDPDFPLYTLGSAYWAKATGTVKVHASGRLASRTDIFTIPLTAGWNQISSVHITPVVFGNLHVVRNGEEVSLSTAASRGWIRDYAWRYDTGAKTYQLVSATQSGAETTLRPWEGYWIRALVDCDLVIPPVGS